jgi:hypothetical protein
MVEGVAAGYVEVVRAYYGRVEDVLECHEA